MPPRTESNDAAPAAGRAAVAPALGAVDILLVSCSFLAAYAITGMVPVLPALRARFAATPGVDYLVSLIVAIVGLSMIVAAPLTSLLARRISAPTILVAGFAASGLAALASALATSLVELLAARFIQGCGVAAASTIAISMISARNIGLIGFHIGSSAVVMLVLLPLSGLVGDISWRLSAALGGLALLYAGAAIALLRTLHEIPLASASPPGEPRPAGRTGGPSLLLIGGFALVVGILEYSSPAFLPFVAVRSGLSSAWEISLLTSLSLVTSAVASLAYGWLTRRFATTTLFLLAFGGSGFGAALIALGGGTWSLATGALLMGCGGGLALPHVYASALAAARPEAKVATAATIRATTFSGLLSGPLLLQMVVARADVFAAFWTLLAVSLVLLPWAAMLFRNTAAPRSAAQPPLAKDTPQ